MPDPAPTSRMWTTRECIFVALALACAAAYLGVDHATKKWVLPAGLALGVVVALAGRAAFQHPAKKWSRVLIQVSIVLMGFSMDLAQVARAGLTGIAFAAGTIAATFALGWLLGRLLRTPNQLTALLSAGTAICGGSAIAATASVIGAPALHISVAMATVFILNGIALYLFPVIGHALDLTQEQFGAWAAIAIHDVSSVVGAAGQFGDVALQEATAIKLTRTLWIVPVALLARWVYSPTSPSRSSAPDAAHADAAAPAQQPPLSSETGSARTPGAPESAGPRAPTIASRASAPIPWFIALFVAACVIRKLVPAIAPAAVTMAEAAKAAMCVALFLIGSGMSRAAISSVGFRPFLQGLVLWIAISLAGLVIVRWTVGPPSTNAPHSPREVTSDTFPSVSSTVTSALPSRQ